MGRRDPDPPPALRRAGFAGTVELVPPSRRWLARAEGALRAQQRGAWQHPPTTARSTSVRLLVPTSPIWRRSSAALSLGNPGLPLNANVKQLVPIAKAIEPIRAPGDRSPPRSVPPLRRGGGRTNSIAGRARSTRPPRARSSCRMTSAPPRRLRQEDKEHLQARMDDLLVFVTSDRYTRLPPDRHRRRRVTRR